MRVLTRFLGIIILTLGTMGAAHGTESSWTLLLYLNGDNNLDHYVQNILKRVERGVVNSKKAQSAQIVVQMDGAKVGDSARFLLKRDAQGRLQKIVLQKDVEYDMGSTAVLSQFVEWGVRTFPSEKVALAIVGHGRGILNIPAPDGSFGGAVPRPFASSSDDTSGTFMEEEEMVARLLPVMRKVRPSGKLDLLVYNSCLMGNLEVLRALSQIAEFAIASEYTICVDIDDTLEKDRGVGVSLETLVKSAHPGASAVEIGKQLVAAFRENYKDMGLWNDASETVEYCKSTLSLFDLGKVASLVEAWKRAAEQVTPSDFEPLFVKMLAEPQVDTLGYTDLGVLSKTLFEVSGKKVFGEIAAQLYTNGDIILDRAILHLEGQLEPAGVSVFFPSVIARPEQVNPFVGFYSALEFSRVTGWGRFVQRFRQHTELERLPILGRLVEEVFKGRIPRVRPSEDPVYNEHMLYMMAEIALDDALVAGRKKQAQSYGQLVRESSYQGEEFLLHRKDVLEKLRDTHSK